MTVPTEGIPAPDAPNVTATFVQPPANTASTGTNIQFVPAPAAAPTPGARWTDEDLSRVRVEEKNKLYGKIETLEQTVQRLQQEREAEVARLEAERLAAEESARKQVEADTDVRTLLQQKEQEWEQRLAVERQERENALALLQQEQRFQQLNEYRSQAVAAAQNDIVPELIDLVSGNTPEEIDQSIQGLKDRSARILESAQAAMQSQRQQMAGARVTAPAAGPLDNTSENQQLTPEQIANLSMTDYQRYRSRLLGQAGNNAKGLFG